jgi:hypothetical protein
MPISTALAPHTAPFLALLVVHLLGMALLLGNLVLLELRVWGLGAALPVRALGRLTIGLALVGFSLSAASGVWMFASQANALLAHRVFTLKILLLTTLACNAAWFHGRGSLDKLDFVAKAQLLASTLLWLAVVGCGRVLTERV